MGTVGGRVQQLLAATGAEATASGRVFERLYAFFVLLNLKLILK